MVCLDAKPDRIGSSSNIKNGAVYIRWGKTRCPSRDTKLVYSGYAAGAYYTQNAGSDTQCLPRNPNWRRYHDGDNPSAFIYGAEYQLYFSVGETLHKKYHDYKVPCAVCQSKKRLNVHMIPAKDRCHSYGWHLEYRGYLMTQYYSHGASNYVCVDAKPDTIGSRSNKDSRLFYPVESICGSLPCPPYVKHRELTCALYNYIIDCFARMKLKIVYLFKITGYAAGSHFTQNACVNTQCLPKDPSWRRYHDGYINDACQIYGAEYQVHPYSVGEALHNHYHDYNVPCAVCQSKKRLNQKIDVYNGWHLEYRGYLMAQRHDQGASKYLCVDARPEKIGSKSNQDGRLFYPVEGHCHSGSLPCPPYVPGRELTCALKINVTMDGILNTEDT
ncbi:hypothetical protein KUTeg_021932 [Tegillarca granosa]|uniref:Short-chain collagen C4-like n=1 Tax=Tegillarca granosa TaxID=220873 RepID=A0ABQ9E4S7_TEGGR|nr:hypothetical protein KUTeg_021932 [Tegillarca granosa]